MSFVVRILEAYLSTHDEITLRNTQMNTIDRKPYGGITPEELQAAIARAHAERAVAVREMFHALGAWIARLVHREHGTGPGLRTATGR
jgi:hypothetical protein